MSHIAVDSPMGSPNSISTPTATKRNKIIDKMRRMQAEEKLFVSFEFFPPKTEDGIAPLLERIKRFRRQDPLFMDMTWGAGGSTSDLTLDLCLRMQKDLKVEANMHLTCTNMPEEKVDHALEACKKGGITSIVALRGDPPKGAEKWVAAEGGFNCALDLVKHIRQQYGDQFCIAVSGYPEGHPNAITKVEDPDTLTVSELTRLVKTEEGDLYVCRDEDFERELEYLKKKVEAGADFIITQMVFDAEVYGNFVKACRSKGINVPILPGIMCIQTYSGFKRMTAFCKSRVPDGLAAELEPLEGDKEAMHAKSVDFGTKLARRLIELGAPGLHFYTLNLERVTLDILTQLGLNKVPNEQ